MKRSVIALLGLVLLLSIGALTAQTGSASYVSGTVVSSTDTTLVIRTDSGEEMTFTVDSATMRPASMAAGARIDVKYHLLSGGANHAAEVRMTDSTNPAPTATSAKTSEQLPQTATPIVPIGLTGLMTLGGALGLLYLARRSSSVDVRR